jgi:hypothetical protein
VGRKKSLDWLNVLDFKRAMANVEGDLVGDWCIDPWGWPELRWLVEPAQARLLLGLVRRRKPGVLARLDVPKENFGVRPATVMHVADRLVYQALVDRLAVPLIGDLAPTVFNWRLERHAPRAGTYLKSGEEWDRYRAWLQESLERHPNWLLQTDIVSCFARISMRVVEETLETRRVGGSEPASKILAWLETWDRTPGRGGLPQRSRASAALANACLRAVDDVLAQTPAGGRWMDDISVFASSEADARRHQLRLNDVVREMGLELNSAKTAVLAEDDAAAEVLELELRTIAYALTERDDPTPLHQRLEEIEASPSEQPRTVLNFVCSRIIEHKLVDEAERILAIVDRVPHAADHAARMAQMLELHHGRSGWFTGYYGSQFARVRWAPGRLLLMFPSSERPEPALIDLAVAALSEVGVGPVMLAAAATRLVGWLERDAVDLLRAAIEKSETALDTRVLAMAALSAGESHARVARQIGRFDDLATTSKYLEATDYRTPRLHRSFGAGEAAD